MESTGESTDGFEALARLEELPENGLFAVRNAAGERICLVNAGGRISALRDVCSHQDFPLSQGTVLPGGEVECIWHGARFDACTGAVRRPPATEPVAVFPVRIEDGVILVGPRRA